MFYLFEAFPRMTHHSQKWGNNCLRYVDTDRPAFSQFALAGRMEQEFVPGHYAQIMSASQGWRIYVMKNHLLLPDL